MATVDEPAIYFQLLYKFEILNCKNFIIKLKFTKNINACAYGRYYVFYFPLLTIYLSVCLFVCLSVRLSVCLFSSHL